MVHFQVDQPLFFWKLVANESGAAVLTKDEDTYAQANNSTKE